MITFTKVPAATLDVATGNTTGLPEKKPEPTIGALPIPEFHNQVMALASQKVPLDKALSAIDKHPDITDKPRAKMMAHAVYQILNPKTR